MNHETTRDLLPELALDLLPASRADDARKHARGCDLCRGEFALYGEGAATLVAATLAAGEPGPGMPVIPLREGGAARIEASVRRQLGLDSQAPTAVANGTNGASHPPRWRFARPQRHATPAATPLARIPVDLPPVAEPQPAPPVDPLAGLFGEPAADGGVALASTAVTPTLSGSEAAPLAGPPPSLWAPRPTAPIAFDPNALFEEPGAVRPAARTGVSGWWRSWALLTTGGVVILIAMLLFAAYQAIQSRQDVADLQSAQDRYAMKIDFFGADARGVGYVAPTLTTGVLVLDGLPPVTGKSQYILWADSPTDGITPVKVVRLSRDTSRTYVDVPKLTKDTRRLWVTLEPDPSTRTPTGPELISGSVPPH